MKQKHVGYCKLSRTALSYLQTTTFKSTQKATISNIYINTGLSSQCWYS